MKNILKALERYKKEQNLPWTSYLDLEALTKAIPKLRKQPEQRQEVPAAKYPKHSTARMTQGKLAHSLEEVSARQQAMVYSSKQMVSVKSKDRLQLNKNHLIPGQKQPDDSLQENLPAYSEQKIDKNLISIVKPFSLEADLFKVLRGKILFPVSGKPPRSVMVTSAAPGEGKSFIASNLAINLAQNIAQYVLLVDCDLRRPCLHQRFGFGRVKGLTEHLSNGTGLSSLLLKTVVEKLTLLPAGQPPLNPSEILSSAKMADLIDELKSRYDDRYLVFDSPPPMLAPETIAIAKHVDGIIVVIKFGDTSFKMIDQMIDNMGKEKILGAVLNRIEIQTSGYYYSYRKYRKYY